MGLPDPWTDDPWTDPEVTHDGIELVAAYRRNRGFCGICGRTVDLHITSGDEKPTLDHIFPVSRGGGDQRENLQIAHWRCNRWKGNRLIQPAPERVPLITITFGPEQLLELLEKMKGDTDDPRKRATLDELIRRTRGDP